METISSGIVTIAGVTSTNLEVIQEGSLRILEEGMAQGITLSDGGTAVVSSGGKLVACTVSSGGTATILEEGYAEDVTVEQSGVCMVSNGIAHHSIVNSGGTQILNGADALSISAVVMAGGTLEANNDGYAKQTTVYGTVEVSGAMAYKTTVLAGGVLKVKNGNADNTAVSSGGLLILDEGGFNQNDSIYEGGRVVVSSGGISYNVKNSGGRIEVENGGVVMMATVTSGGRLVVSSGGGATNVTWTPCEGIVEIEDGATVTFKKKYSGVYCGSDNRLVSSASTMASKTIGAAETMCVMSGGVVKDVTVVAGGGLFLYGGGRFTGTMNLEGGADVSAGGGAILDFDLTQIPAGEEARINDLSIIRGTPVYTLTVSADQKAGNYALADGAAGFNSTISAFNPAGDTLGTLTVGETIKIGDADYTLNLTDSLLTLTVVTPDVVPTNLVGTKDGVSWDSTGAANYVVEYSMDDFESVLQTATESTAVDMYELPAGTYQWRVREDSGEEWAVGNAIESEAGTDAPKVVRSNADGSKDLFFAATNGTWDNFCFAMHVGSINDWTGTNEVVSANGRGIIQNLFFGSADPNVLCLTDGDNGDAIFVDDIYTELPEEIETNTARLYEIQEIRAGAGNDIVDMTSQRFEYTGNGLTIRGGDGDDVIWANKGDNWLFGDAGNDRIVGASGNDVIAGGTGNDSMHGGGGEDTFTFCENWGTDTVEQFETGMVTLWFVSGSLDNWNSETLTYTDGDNSVTVKGVTSVELKFGIGITQEDASRFAELSDAGAFEMFTSHKIFEESGKSMLAEL